MEIIIAVMAMALGYLLKSYFDFIPRDDYEEIMTDEAYDVVRAAENMVDVRGRFHSELAMRNLIEKVKNYREAKK